MNDGKIAASFGVVPALALIALLALPAPALFAAGADARGQGQSLAELAKKEKERRAALKGKPTTVVTNADLAKMKKEPALAAPPPAPPGATEGGTQATAAGQAAEATQAAGAGKVEPDAEAPVTHTVVVAPTEPKSGGSRTELEGKLAKATEYVELLTLKMNSLWQQFYAQGDPTPKDLVQQQIAETYEKLLQAQDEAAKAKADLDAAVARSRTDVPSIWIR